MLPLTLSEHRPGGGCAAIDAPWHFLRARADEVYVTPVSAGVINWFWLEGMMDGLKGQLDCIKQFPEVAFTGDLKTFDLPTLIAHGDDDQIVPIGASAMLSSKLVANAKPTVYPGGRMVLRRRDRTSSTSICRNASEAESAALPAF